MRKPGDKIRFKVRTFLFSNIVWGEIIEVKGNAYVVLSENGCKYIVTENQVIKNGNEEYAK